MRIRSPLIALALCALMLTGCERLFPSAYEGVKLCERWEEALDQDGDTYPSCVNPTWPWKVAQARPADCDDTDPNIHPGATEVCEASRDVDEDCDGKADNDDVAEKLPGEPAVVGTQRYYPDNDQDGWGDGDSRAVIETCDNPNSLKYVVESEVGDCNDADPTINYGASERCDGKDNDCDGEDELSQDADGDSYPPCRADGEIYDCDDKSALFHPGAAEVCNSVDDDCDGEIDEFARTAQYLDADKDGYGNVNAQAQEVCLGTPGYADNNTDCNDAASSVHPLADEVCDGRDNDCDDKVDEGLRFTRYRDNDRDGFGSKEAQATQVCPDVQGYADDNTDCDDGNDDVNPAVAEVCNGRDDDCDGLVDEHLRAILYPDADGDHVGNGAVQGQSLCNDTAGYALSNTDCDDANPEVRPGVPERCNYLDDDCDGSVDESPEDPTLYYVDADGDRFGVSGPGNVEACPSRRPSGHAPQSAGLDCDDTTAAVHPGQTESCNGIDEDCDGGIDENFDDDGDRFSPCGLTALTRDCDDDDPKVFPSATEKIDFEDNDCDGEVDEDTPISDPDGDGYCEADDCEGLPYNPGDCGPDDPTVHPGATELVDGKDQNCDGRIDEHTAVYDDDGDGYCEGPTCLGGATPGDCDDSKPSLHPGSDEVCDGADNDCDGKIDEGLPTSPFYPDKDRDGYGKGDAIAACPGGEPQPTSENAADCDDADPYTYPGAFESSNGKDDDCDAKVDENYDRDGDGFCESADFCWDGNSKGDCDATDPAVNPQAPELCSGLDEDCDHKIDEGWLSVSGSGECDQALVPAGDFWRGIAPALSQASTQVRLAMDETEVTYAQYKAFLDTRCTEAAPCVQCGRVGSHDRVAESESHLQCSPAVAIAAGYDDHPMTGITWYGAAEYCASLGMRLPTSDEVQKAARGGCEAYGSRYSCDGGTLGARGEQATFPWGSALPGSDCGLAQLAECGATDTAPVDAHPRGASIYGIQGLAGNAAEWLLTCSGGGDPAGDGTCPNGNAYIAGGRYSEGADQARIGALGSLAQLSGDRGVGFRCVKELP